MQKAQSDRPIVIVPDGMSMLNKKLVPSFVYRAVLDKVLESMKGDEEVFLTPGNYFGFEISEQQLAYNYLISKSSEINALVVPTGLEPSQYVDTYGNALYMMKHFKERKKNELPSIQLYVAKLHAKRAELNFRKIGFQSIELNSVDYEISKEEKIVDRLFYYKYKWLHRIYEALVYWRDKIFY